MIDKTHTKAHRLTFWQNSLCFYCSLDIRQLYLFFFENNTLNPCIYAFVVTSRAPSLLRSPTSKLLSHHAAHITARSKYYKKIGYACLYLLSFSLSRASSHSEIISVQIDKIYFFLIIFRALLAYVHFLL